MTKRNYLRCATALFALVFLTGPAQAQRKLTFNPYLFLEQNWTDNARFVPVGKESDTFTRLSVVLPVRYNMGRPGSLFASYQYFADRFSSLSDLDSDGHLFSAGWTVKPSEPSTFRLGASYLLRDDRARLRSNLEEDLFLTPRVTNEVKRVGASYSRRLSQTWQFSTGLTFVDLDFERATADQNDLVLTRVQGRDGWIFDINLGKRLSERSTMGIGYTYSDYTLDPIPGDPQFTREGDEQIHNPYWFWRYTLGPLWRWELRLGYFDRSGTNSNGSTLDRSGGSGRFTAYRSFRRTRLEMFAGYGATSGGSLRGTATVTTLGVALNDATPGRWDWEIFARASRREPELATEADIDIFTGGGYLQWNLQRLLSLRLTSVYAEQTSDDFFSNRSVTRISLGLYWFPLGRTEIGGAPAVPFSDFEE